MQRIDRDVLLVDDEPDIRELCRINLELAGCTVRDVSHAGQVVPAIRDREPDVVVLDLRMPGGTGWSVLCDLKKDPRLAAVPVVLLSADSDAADVLDCWEPGLLELVEKPFLPTTLVETVGRAGTAVVDVGTHAARVLVALTRHRH